MTTRPLSTADDPLLVRATLGNLNWSGPRFTETDVLGRPDFVHYTRLVPARGDFGLVAEDAQHEPAELGVAWALRLPPDDAGYGFVDADTPEVSLWVRDDVRGRGVGTLLLRRLQQVARDRGLARLSLSVEAGNPAVRLYTAAGFTPVRGREDDGVMLWAP